MKKYAKLVLLFLTVCLTLSLIIGVIPIYADSDEALQANVGEQFTPPDIVSREEAAENGYVGRDISAETDLNTFVFENADGTKTMRLYSHPVKYVDSDGTTKDISLEIKERSDGSFSTAAHAIITTFEKKLSDGVSLEYNDVEVKLVPIAPKTAQTTASASADKRSVTYALDSTTSYVYELTYAGFKEDIVVSEYTGQTEYSFTLYTNGLTLCEEYGSYYLADAEGKVKATVGDIIVFTADERNNTMGSMTYETVRANQEYKITIHLDANYLRDEATKYPIRIDPTIEYNYDNEGAGAIEDVSINQYTTFSSTSGSLSVGRHPAGSLSRTLMRFPNLQMPVEFGPLVLSAQVELRDLMCQANENITVHCYQYNESSPAWSESGTTTWSSVGSSYYSTNASLDSKLITYGNGDVEPHRYSFDITALARRWADGVASPSKGIVLAASPDFEAQTGTAIKNWVKTFASYNRSANKPSLTIDYDTKAIVRITHTAYGTKYLNAGAIGEGGVTLPTNPEQKKGGKLWYIQSLPQYDNQYVIIALGEDSNDGVNPCAIYSTTQTAGLAILNVNSSLQRYRPIRASDTDDAYYFKSINNGLYLSAPSGATHLTASATENSNTKFMLEVQDYRLFNNFWSGTYTTGIYSGVAHIKVKLDASITSSNLFKNNNFSSALLWNGITDNVIIYGPNDTVPAGITPFVVTYKAYDFGADKGDMGLTVPNGIAYSTYSAYSQETIDALNASNWSSVTIYLNSSASSNNPFVKLQNDTAKFGLLLNKVITHEMGHALKLAHHTQKNGLHEFEDCYGGVPGTTIFVDNGQEYPVQDQTFFSVMNQGYPFETDETRGWYPLTASVPQIFDQINLANKWERHQNCTH